MQDVSPLVLGGHHDPMHELIIDCRLIEKLHLDVTVPLVFDIPIHEGDVEFIK